MSRHLITLLAMAALVVAPAWSEDDKPTAFETMASHYESIRLALLHDTMEGVSHHAAMIRDTAKELESSFDVAKSGVAKDKAGECQELVPEIRAAAEEMARVDTLEGARASFGLLSKPMIRFRSMVSGERPVVVYCSMAEQPWLQPRGEIGNPYYGQSMARCGQVVSDD